MPHLPATSALELHREARNALRKSDDDQRQDRPENETPILRKRLQLILQKV